MSLEYWKNLPNTTFTVDGNTTTVIEFYDNKKIRSISVWEYDKKINHKKFYKTGKLIEEWRREDDINCILSDLAKED